VLAVSGKLQYGWVVGAKGRQEMVVFKNEKGKCMDALGQV